MDIDEIIQACKKPFSKGWIRALLIIIPFFIFTLIFQAAGYFLLGKDPRFYSELTIIDKTVIRIVNTAGTFILVFIFVHFLDRASIKSLGFQMKNFTASILSGIAAGALIIAAGFYILLFLNEIQVTGIYCDRYKLLVSIVLFLFVSLNEELIIRGYILNNLMQSMNKYAALLASSLIFSLFHIFNPNFDLISFISIVLAGLLLGISYIYTKNLWFPIALHFSWNFFQGTVFGFNVSGQNIYSVINQHPVDNNIMNGGEFGFEGSIIAQIFIVFAVIAIWRFAERKTGKIRTDKID
jgi:membrane protease YdiL (CAAX protease family)